MKTGVTSGGVSGPCDRLLVAQARIHDLYLVTMDDMILTYPHVRTLDARL